MGRLRDKFFCMLGCLLTTVSLSWGGDQSLGHYAILKADQQTAEVLQNRFKARGEPLFMVRDPQVGVSPGDIIRFANKVVLVDAAVMQTLATEGILRHLGQSTVLRLRAKSQSSIWNTRSSLVENAREQKAYHLGANMLKVFEDYFGKSPATGEMALHFTGSDLELVVPDAFLDRLSFNNVRRVHPSGSPLLVSDPPHLPLFQGETFQWRAWGADPASAEADLQYGPLGTAPPGLLWNDSLHAWVGKLDRVGNYSLGAWVRNSNGFADSLRFSLNVRTDVPPHLLNRPLQGLHPGDSIQGALAIEDPDHALIDLRCSSSDGPAWFLVDSLCEFHAKPPLNWNGRDSVRLRVQDPLGAADSTTLPLGEVPEFSSLLHAIRFLVPRDTLVLGREYGWEAQTLLTPGIHLLGVEGMTGATWNGRRLRIQPWTEGKNNLRFRLATSADTVVLSQTLFVKPNQPPRFQSSLSAVLVREGTSLHYRPVAIDPEGDPVAYEARYSDGGDIRVVQGELDLWTRSPGVYAMEVLAGDGVNSPTQQYVSWTVENDRREWLGGGLRMITVGGDQYWWLFARRGAARFGLFTPRLGDVMRAEPNTTKEWPFFFAGASLLGERGLARGNWLYVDLGLELRNPNKRLVTGGFMLGLDGHWSSQDRKHPWVFELELNAHSNQAILLVDTSGWSDADLSITVNNSELRLDDVDSDTLLASLFGEEVYEKIVDDIQARENTVLLSRMEILYPFLNFGSQGSLLGGLVVWREDYLNDVDLNQNLGISARHQLERRYWNLTQSLRLPLFHGGKSSSGLRYDLQINVGVWK